MMPRSCVALLLLAHASYGLQPFSQWGHERIQLTDVSIHFRYSASGKPPLLLVHGFPEHSPTWTEIGPILAEHYTVIAADNRGNGDSSLSVSDNYTAAAGGEDLRSILDFLNITKANVFAHDKGVGLASSLALEHPERINRLVLSEYPLPGFGYPTSVDSSNLYRDWQLAFFAVPDAAEYFIRGREKQMLAWYFYHGSYSGDDVVSNDLLETYTRAMSKPGFLRAGMQYFAAAFADKDYFLDRVGRGKLQMPLLVLGGEASFSPASAIRSAFAPIADDLSVDVIPKAGHWIV
jgi:pimeloyl-ACP methyl ester carboxylesterase